MIIKSFKNEKIECLIVLQEFEKYAAIRLPVVRTPEFNSEYHPGLDFESASDVFDIWVEQADA